jgi:hypothetical protein
MAKHRDEDKRPSDMDIMSAAFEANCREWEKKTGRSREAMFAEMDKMDPNAGMGARMAQDHYSEMISRGGSRG